MKDLCKIKFSYSNAGTFSSLTSPAIIAKPVFSGSITGLFCGGSKK